MKHLFIIDPFESLKPNHDSSLALMKAALKKGHEVFCIQTFELTWQVNSLRANAQKIIVGENNNLQASNQFETLNLSQKQQLIVWMRKDPPVNQDYIKACQLLRLAKVPVLNNPNSLLSCEEKLFALEFPELIPSTTITQSIRTIKELVKQKGQLIAKPIGGKAGEGILLLKAEDKNLSSLLELLTAGESKKIIVQEFLPEAIIGDKRIFLCAGEPIGALLRVPKADDNRANMAAGGSVAKTTITSKELEICKSIKPRLLELGLYIVGIDVIGEKLTEINITSPTCLEEIGQLEDTNPAGEIIDWSISLF
jgi:glutathione synthase